MKAVYCKGIVLFLINVVLASCNENMKEAPYECNIYLAPSLIPGIGRGIFAGKNFSSGDIIDIASSLAVLRKNGKDWPLHNYVYSTNNDKYSMALFGMAMMLNHGVRKDVEHFWNDWPVLPISHQKLEAHTVFTTVIHKTTRNIAAGEEIFTSYGGTEWFTSRGIEYDPLTTDSATKAKYTSDELASRGHCLSDIFVDESTLPLAGKGLFASRDFKKDEIVSISPVLVLPKHGVASDEGVLLNYCISSPGSDVALLPIGLTALANHGGSDSNLAITWFAWDDDEDFSERLKRKPDDLFNSHFAQLDISIIASRDIAAGEELLLFYGEDWEREWVAHLDRLLEWSDDNGQADKKPQFRFPIAAPEGLFPRWWRGSCIGPGCQMINVQAEIDGDPELRRKQAAAKASVEAAIQRAKQLARKTYVKPGTGSGSCSSKPVESTTAPTGLLGSLMAYWSGSESGDM